MESVGIFEAKNHFSELIERVQRGQTVTITKHGKPVAQLVQPKPNDAPLSPEDVARRQRWLESVLARKAAFVAAGGVLRGQDSAAQLVRAGREEQTDRLRKPATPSTKSDRR
jgi:prevent-host-death family protein